MAGIGGRHGDGLGGIDTVFRAKAVKYVTCVSPWSLNLQGRKDAPAWAGQGQGETIDYRRDAVCG